MNVRTIAGSIIIGLMITLSGTLTGCGVREELSGRNVEERKAALKATPTPVPGSKTEDFRKYGLEPRKAKFFREYDR